MNREPKTPLVHRLAAWTLIPAQVLVAVPVTAQEASASVHPPTVVANRTLPLVRRPDPSPRLPPEARVEHFTSFRGLTEPLLPVGTPSPGENRALALAANRYLDAGDVEDVRELTGFLARHPKSAWVPSVQLQVGLIYRARGYFSRALDSFEAAWNGAKHDKGTGRPVADRALGELAELSGSLGRYGRLEELLGEAADRDLVGVNEERLAGAREALWLMRNDEGSSFRCGPLAIHNVLHRTGSLTEQQNAAISRLRSTARGTSLAQVADLARAVGLSLRTARRVGGAGYPVPSVVHWRSGHFAAITERDGDRYRIEDPTFGSELWVSEKALLDEGSGYALVPESSLADGYAVATAEEAATVWGRGITRRDEKRHSKECDERRGGGGGCPSGNCSKGMPQYSFHAMLVSLAITDSPVGYHATHGPSPDFRVNYIQREVYQPDTFAYTNFGHNWTSNWISYVKDDGSTAPTSAELYAAGGGAEQYTGITAATSSREVQTRTTLVRVSNSPIRYERRHPDGAYEEYSVIVSQAPDRKVFLSRKVDAEGHELAFVYDANARLVAVQDAQGLVTTIAYNGDESRVSRITDPFGRFATFEYENGKLAAITDVIGLRSEFTYAGSFITAMKTPYGTTRFRKGEVNPDQVARQKWLEATDPLGGTERLEFRQETASTGVPPGQSGEARPLEMDHFYNYDDGRNTFFWDKRAMALHPGDYLRAEILHWVHEDTTPGDASTGGVLESVKRPLENRIYFNYAGQAGAATLPALSVVTKSGRLLADGSTQLWQNEYNTVGSRIRSIDPLGRKTVYAYGTGTTSDPVPAMGQGTDLLEVKQRTGTDPETYDVLARYEYDTAHRVKKAFDASGSETTYDYTSSGQLSSVTTPARAGVSENRTTTYAYDAEDRLTTVTDPAGGQTTYTYDDFNRVASVTNSDQYTVSYEYDALDRVTKITYPDGTFEQTVYDRLDPVRQRDRLGRWSETRYDALRRVVLQRDAAGRVVIQEWCGCGSLDALIDPNGNKTRWERDLQGRVTAEIRPDGARWMYAYDDTGRLVSVTDAKGQIKTYTYAVDDRLASIAYDNATHTTPGVAFTYDAVYPRLVRMVDGTGATTYAYYPVVGAPLGAGMLQAVDGPLTDDTITYAYDELGRVKARQVNGSANEVTYGYDLLGRMTSQVNLLGTFSFAYADATSRLTSVTYPNGQTSEYEYLPNTGDRRLASIHHKKPAGGGTLASFDYTTDAGGRILTWRQQQESNPAKEYTFGYDAADQLTMAVLRDDATQDVLKTYGYAYDPAGNRTLEAIDQAATTAAFNARNQLTATTAGGAILFQGQTNEPASVTVGGVPAQTTAAGSFVAPKAVTPGQQNIVIAATDGSGNTRTNTYQVTGSGEAATYTYDPNGNMTARTENGTTTTYEWDAENRLIAVKQGGNTLASFTYDGHGRRYSTTTGGATQSFVHAGMDVVEERATSGLRRHFRGPGIDRQLGNVDSVGVKVFLVADHLGSVRTASDHQGVPTLTRDYDPYGRPIAGASASGYAFTGREWESPTGLQFSRARFYDPSGGRFISEDPIGIRGGLNRFAYAAGNPVRFVDPFGWNKGDPWYGETDRDFKRYVEKRKRDENRPASDRLDKDTLEEWKADWQEEGSPKRDEKPYDRKDRKKREVPDSEQNITDPLPPLPPIPDWVPPAAAAATGAAIVICYLSGVCEVVTVGAGAAAAAAAVIVCVTGSSSQPPPNKPPTY